MTTTAFDLDAYLRRIGLAGRLARPAPTLHTLRAIAAAQPAHIAFENLDPFLGRVPELHADALRTKLLLQRRGGYCYEVNALLRDALQAIGFQVTGLAARVLWGLPRETPLRPRSHMLLRVDLPGEAPQLVDAGFGGRLLDAPMALLPGSLHESAAGRARLLIEGGDFVLESEGSTGWHAVYRFGLDPHLPVDYEPLNWFTARRPGSLFAHNLMIERLTSQRRASLFNDRLSLQPHGQPITVRRLTDAADLARLLDEVFDLQAPVAADDLFARLPRGLDGPVTRAD